MALAYLHYDVFTGEPLAGNQLAVFPDARGLGVDRMQRLAREMNFSETTFVLPAEIPGTDVRMRIFTPFVEMPMAGHPTVGSTFALAALGTIAPSTPRFVFGLNVGPTPVDLEWRGAELAFAWMNQVAPVFGAPVHTREAVASALALSPDDLVPSLPAQSVSCGVPFLFVPLRDRAAVDRAVPDVAALRRLAVSTGIDLPIFLFSAEGMRAGETVYSRMFAPTLGVVEDPATGGASGPLGCYLVEHGIVGPGRAAAEIVSLQGVAMGRPSRIHVAVEGARGAIRGVKVGGEAVLVARGEMLA